MKASKPYPTGGRISCLCLIVAVLSLILFPDGFAEARTPFEPGGKTPVQNLTVADGPYVTCAFHDVGKIGLMVNNYAGIGTCPVPSTGWSDPIPSCEYPYGSDKEYLFAGALWIGAVVGGDTLVSVGMDGWYATCELYPDEFPAGDIIHRSTLSGDPDAVSEQDYIAVYTDTLINPLYVNPDPVDGPHRPMNVAVTQKSYAWSAPEREDFVIFEYSVENIGSLPLEQAYIGFYIDGDVHYSSILTPANYTDDISGFLETTPSPLGCGWTETIDMAYIMDNNGRDDGDPSDACPFGPKATTSVTGIRLLASPSDSLRLNFNWWVSNGNAALDFGPRQQGTPGDPFRDFHTGGLGTPVGDADKYYLLSHAERDYNQITTAVDHSADGWLPPPINSLDLASGHDTKYLLSFGPFNIDAGQTLSFAVAYVAGENVFTDCEAWTDLYDPWNPEPYFNTFDFTDLAFNALRAEWVYDIPGYDTDGDGYAGKYRICYDSTIIGDTVVIVTEDTLYYKGDGVPDLGPAGPYIDTIPPVITCPDDISIPYGVPTDPEMTGYATAVDDYDPDALVSYEDIIDTNDMWLIDRLWTAIDSVGNVSHCHQSITLYDDQYNLVVKAHCPQSVNGIVPLWTDFNIDIWILNASENGDLAGGGFSFKLYSPGESMGSIDHVDRGGILSTASLETINGFDDYFNLGVFTAENGWNGLLPDTVNFNMVGTSGIPPGEPMRPYLRFHLNGTETGRLCIDSCTNDANPDWDWLFMPEMHPVAFNGPYCWTVGHVIANRSWYVSPYGDNDTGMGTIDYPFATIQFTIDMAQTGDTILALPGTYEEYINFLGKDLIVKSTDGPLKTTITSASDSSLVTFASGENHAAVLEGFTLEAGWIGILCENSTPTIRRNILHNQKVTDWAAISMTGNAGFGKTMGPIIENNTIVGCFNGGISSYFETPPIIKNNIVAFNSNYGIHVHNDPAIPVPLLSYNDVYGHPENYQVITDPGIGSISADPMFNIDHPFLTLKEGSPCIDAGDPDPWYNDPDGSRNDMGAVPYVEMDEEVIPTPEWINVYCGSPVVDSTPLQYGDVISAYDPDGVLCGRTTVKEDGSFGFMPIYRDYGLTDIDEGADPGDLIHFRINGQDVGSVPPVTWTTNGDNIIVCIFYTHRCVAIDLETGWNLISWNVAYGGPVEQLIDGIENDIDVILSYDGGGLTYDPLLPEFSTLTTADFVHGYWFLMHNGARLNVCGGEISSYSLLPVFTGWNLVSYWPYNAYSVEVSLASIMSCLQAVLGFDGTALTWMPGYEPFNTLTDMQPLFGYWVHSGCDGLIEYPGFTGLDSISPAKLTRNKSSVPHTSRYWMSVYGRDITLDGESLGNGATIEIRTADNIVCGRGFYGDGLLKFTPVYGRDTDDDNTAKYPVEGGTMAVYVDGIRSYPNIVWNGHGTRFELREMKTDPSGSSGQVPTDFALSQNFPNPFNPLTTIELALPVASNWKISIFNIRGQKVDEFQGHAEAGYVRVNWDATPYASGIYVYRGEAGAFKQTRKMILVK